MVTATSKNRPIGMHARDAKTRWALHATTPLLLLLHACARPRGSCADAELATPQKHPPCPGARCTASPARARPPRRHIRKVMPVCSSSRRRRCAAIPRGRGYNPCPTLDDHDPRGWTSPLASFFATEGLRENSGRRAAGDGWTETVSMTGSSAECPLSGVDHHSSTATTVTFANGRANDVHLSGSCQAARGSGIRRCSPGRSSYTARGWGTSGSPRTAVAR